jgi:hypothetical protein
MELVRGPSQSLTANHHTPAPNSPIQLTIEMTAVARNVAFIMDRRIFLTCGVSHCWCVGIA